MRAARRRNTSVLGLRFAEGRDGRLAEAQVEVAVGLVEVVVLEGGGRGQHDVREVDGVGGEEVVHDREQVLAGEALAHALLLGGHRHRVGVVDEERLHRRIQRARR